MPEDLPRRQKHRPLNLLLTSLLFGFSVLISLGIGELYFRAFDPQAIVPRYVETSPAGIRKNIGHVRGRMITSEYQHDFSTNSQGFRGTREYTLAKPAGTFRIVVLGDSTTLGHGVEDADTFSSRLESLMSRAHPTEVLNFGVSGFGTGEELIQLQTEGLRYAPDLVIVGYFPNDPYNNVVSDLFRLQQGILVRTQEHFVPAVFIRDHLYSLPGWSFLCQHSHLVNFLRNQVSAFFIKWLGSQMNAPSAVPRTLTDSQSKLTSALLRAIVDECRDRKIAVIILNIPVISAGQMFTNMPISSIKDLGLAEHVVDVKNSIFQSHSASELYYPQDSHPRPLAHDLIARWLATYIGDHIQPHTLRRGM